MDNAKLSGITPYVLRLAAYYAAMGVGLYAPRGYAWFDEVAVRELMPWTTGETPTQSTQILVVEFMHDKRRVRYVEFALTPAGWGGEPIVKLVT
jgi:hypothetical protein